MRLFALFVFILIVLGCKMPEGQSQNPDAAVLKQLKAAGDDPSVPRTVNFYLYFPTEAAAKSAAVAITRAGFTPVVRRGAKGVDWLCFATKNLIPTPEALESARTQLEAAAREFGGEYDGWESPVQSRSN